MLRMRNQYGDWVAITDGGFTEDWNPKTAWYQNTKSQSRNPLARQQAVPQYKCEQARADCLRSMSQSAAINAKLGVDKPINNNVQTRKCYSEYSQCMKNRIASNYPVSPFETDPIDAMALSREIIFE